MRYINPNRVIAIKMVTPEDNPLVTDNSRLMDVWFNAGAVVRHEMFKKVRKEEQEALIEVLLRRGFVQSGRLSFDPKGVLFAEMEHELVGGVVTIGYQENGNPVELKVSATAFGDLVKMLENLIVDHN
jgi:hypothetical protein